MAKSSGLVRVLELAALAGGAYIAYDKIVAPMLDNASAAPAASSAGTSAPAGTSGLGAWWHNGDPGWRQRRRQRTAYQQQQYGRGYGGGGGSYYYGNYYPYGDTSGYGPMAIDGGSGYGMDGWGPSAVEYEQPNSLSYLSDFVDQGY